MGGVMALDVDRVAAALLEGTQALIAKELGPLSARLAALETASASLLKRLDQIEGERLPDVEDAAAGLRRLLAAEQ
jgi:hypothetical protein